MDIFRSQILLPLHEKYVQHIWLLDYNSHILKEYYKNYVIFSNSLYFTVGKKNLFLLDANGGQNEVYPLCVLDFYVHESRQRSGCGKALFEYMLQDQKATPKFMAIDRPSPKLLAFLRKYYGLAKAIHQVNNYVIFDGFFSGRPFECSPGPKRARIYMGKLQYV